MRAGTPKERTKLTGTRDGVDESEIVCTPVNSRWKVSVVDRLSLMKVESPSVLGTERGSIQKIGWEGRRGRMVFVRCTKRIQLSRPSKTGCCIVPAGITHAQTASSGEGLSPCRNWMLSGTEIEVRGADLPKSPQERGGACCSQAFDPALLCFMRAQAAADMNVRGGSRHPGGLRGRSC